MGLREDVALHFDRRLDCKSAEAAFHVEPTLAGALTCDGYQFTFSPADAYVRDSDYTFTLHPNCAGLGRYAADGCPCRDLYHGRISCKYWKRYPSDDALQVPVDSEITVVFDRPVIPLLTSASAIDLPQPLLLSPSVSGVRRMDQQRSFMSSHRPNLFKKETTYTASMKQDLQAINGSVLGAPFRWTFETAKPRLLSVFPKPEEP